VIVKAGLQKAARRVPGDRGRAAFTAERREPGGSIGSTTVGSNWTARGVACVGPIGSGCERR
jgi:hypothetical protein